MPEPVEIITTASYAKVTGIYVIVHSQSGKAYVGSASSIKTRIGYHRSKLRHGKHDNNYLQNAWNLHGETAFKFFLIQSCPVQELSKWEAVWMKMLASCCRDHGYNLDSVATHKMHCEETKRKIAASNTGKVFSNGRRKNISLALKGKKYGPIRTPEQRANYSLALMGHVVSEETKRKISAVHRGKKISEKHRQQIRDYWRKRREQRETA